MAAARRRHTHTAIVAVEKAATERLAREHSRRRRQGESRLSTARSDKTSSRCGSAKSSSLRGASMVLAAHIEEEAKPDANVVQFRYSEAAAVRDLDGENGGKWGKYRFVKL